MQRDPEALALLADTEADRIRANKIIQYLFFRQWFRLREYAHEKGVTLFGDMPIYIALDSADAWARRDILRIDEEGRPESVAGGEHHRKPLFAESSAEFRDSRRFAGPVDPDD